MTEKDDVQDVRILTIETTLQSLREELKFCKYVLLAGFASLLGLDMSGVM